MRGKAGAVVPRYALAILLATTAVLVRWLLDPWLGDRLALATLYAAVGVVAWIVGFGPATLSALLGYTACSWLFIEPRGRFAILDRRSLIGLALYLFSCAVIIGFGAGMRRAGRRARESREEVLRILQGITDAFVAFDSDWRYTYVNAEAERQLQRPRAELLGNLIWDMFPQLLGTEVETELRRAMAEQATQEFRVSDPTRGLWFEHRAYPLPGGGLAVHFRDVTDRREAEETLRRSEEAHRLLVGLHDATRGRADPVQVLWEVVTRVRRHFGACRCTYAEVDAAQEHVIVARDAVDGVPSIAGRHRLDQFGTTIVNELRAGRTLIVQDIHTDPRTDDPAVIAAHEGIQARSMLAVPLVRDGRFVAVLALHAHEARAWTQSDATLMEQIAERTWFAVESARAEAALRESRDVLSLAMRGGRMGHWWRDLATNQVWWSRELEEIFGLKPGGFEGNEAGFIASVHEDDRAAVVLAVETALATREDYAIEFRFWHSSGECRWMEGRGRAVYGPDGQPVMLYGLGIDITLRKRAEEALREANRRKDNFLAMLAHELRNPLAPIRNATEILRIKGPAEGEIRVVRDIIDRQVRQMTRLVDDLLDVARITRGKIQLRKEWVDLAAVVGDAIESARPLLEASAHKLTVKLPPRPIHLDADPTRLSQILLNLLNNAAKYTPRGGHIRLAAERNGSEVVITVRDNGIGIAPEHLPHVFEMFSQVTPALERSEGGLGIGLALVRGLLDLHGGSIEAHSEGSGRGSEFTVRLPAVAETDLVERQEPAGTPAGSQGPRCRILVVDDNRDAADSLALMLQLKGHDIRTAEDGAQGVQIAEEYRPDLVLLDIGMPRMNGYEAARHIRQQPWGKTMRLVALTGWGQDEDKRRAAEAGFDQHLTKPVEHARIEALLHGWETEAEAPAQGNRA
jgi:PAS domain S-box-containing protein